MKKKLANTKKIYIHHKDNNVEFKETNKESYYEEIQKLKEDGWQQVILTDEIAQEILIYYFLEKKWEVEEVLVQRRGVGSIPHIVPLSNIVAKMKTDRGYFATLTKDLKYLLEEGLLLHRITLSKGDNYLEIRPNGVCRFTKSPPADILKIVSYHLIEGVH